MNLSGEVAPKPDDKSGLFLRTRGTKDAPAGVQVRGRQLPLVVPARILADEDLEESLRLECGNRTIVNAQIGAS